jgi:hypothetical protein
MIQRVSLGTRVLSSSVSPRFATHDLVFRSVETFARRIDRDALGLGLAADRAQCMLNGRLHSRRGDALWRQAVQLVHGARRAQNVVASSDHVAKSPSGLLD